MKRSLGFSLIEMVIVIVVISIMEIALIPLVVSSLTAYNDTLGDAAVLDKLRYTTERLAREVREIKYASSTDTPATTCPDATTDKYCITTMTASSLVFNRNYIDSSGNTANRNVTIGSSGGNIQLTYSDMSPAPGAVTLTDELTTLAFAYYTDDGTATTLNTNVRFVQISITLTHNGNPYFQRTRVDLRNQ